MIIDKLPTLQGERIRLRQLTDRDRAGILSVFGDPRVVRFMGIPFLDVSILSSDEHARQYIAEVLEGTRSGNFWQWGLALNTTDQVIGSCMLVRFSWGNERAEIGFALAPDHWGKGLMTEALDLLVAHCFEDLSLHRLEADVDPRNTGSIGLLTRMGFVREGILKERHLVDGERQDTVFFGLLSTDWRCRASGRSATATKRHRF